MHRLPDLPDHIGPLRPNSRYEALREREPGLWSDPKAKCPTCGTRGHFTRYNHLTNETSEWACDCTQQWVLYLHLLNAGIRLGYQRASWDDIDAQVPSHVIDAVSGYVVDAERYMRTGRGLILRGTHGTGKTLLATLLLKRLIREGYDGYFVPFHELLDSYTDGWRAESAKHRFKEYLSADFLVIDEVHARNVGGMEHVAGSMFDHLIRVRTGDDKPTIITTNLTEVEMRQGYGSAVMSLLAETSEFVEVTGADFREKVKVRDQIQWQHDAARPIVLD